VDAIRYRRSEGRPANRTLVFRGFYKEETLQFITDRRSEKLEELAKNPYVELHAYYPEGREQFRFNGKCQVISADNAGDLESERHKNFQELSPSTRAQFLWPKSDSDDQTYVNTKELSLESANPVLAKAYENFVLLQVTPSWVDHLELKPFPNIKTVYELGSDGWQNKKSYP